MRPMVAIPAFGLLLVATCLVLADDPIVDYKVITHADGSWTIVWIRKPTSQPGTSSEPTTQPDSSTTTAGGDSATPKSKKTGAGKHRPVSKDEKKDAKGCITRNADALKKAASDRFHINITEGAIRDGLQAMDNAELVDDTKWAEVTKGNPKGPSADGFTKGAKIWLRQSSWDNPGVSHAKLAWLLAHEGIHAILQSTGPSLLGPPDPEQEDRFIEEFLHAHCSAEGNS